MLYYRAMPNARFKSRRTYTAPPAAGNGKAARAPSKRRKAPRIDYEAISGAKPGPMPSIITPQLATLVKAPPAGTGWVHEIKYDGYRMLCRIDNGDTRIISRNGKEWTDDFPAVSKAAAHLPVGQVRVPEHDGHHSGLMADSIPGPWRTLCWSERNGVRHGSGIR